MLLLNTLSRILSDTDLQVPGHTIFCQTAKEQCIYEIKPVLYLYIPS